MDMQIISVASIIGMIFSLAIAIGVPVALLVLIHKKKGTGISSFFLGAATFFVAAMVLEQILHMAVLTLAGEALTGNIWLYGLYGGLAAAVFEETGRFVTMKFFMKKKLNTGNALMYGAGHGGFEAILIVGLAYISNLVTSIMINTGGMEASLAVLDEQTRTTTLESLSALWTTPSYLFYIAGAERIFAIVIQISLSVLMYLGVKYGKKFCIAGAYMLHFLVDFVSVIVSDKFGTIAAEVVILLIAALIVTSVYQVQKKME